MQTIKKTQINAVIYEDATHNATLTGNLCLILIQYIVTNSNGRKGNYTKTWYHRLMQKYVILHNMSCSYTLHLNMETYLFILYFIGPLHHISETVLVFSLQITQSCLSLFKYLFFFFLFTPYCSNNFFMSLKFPQILTDHWCWDTAMMAPNNIRTELEVF